MTSYPYYPNKSLRNPRKISAENSDNQTIKSLGIFLLGLLFGACVFFNPNSAQAAEYTDTNDPSIPFSKEKNHADGVSPYSVRTADTNQTVNYTTPDANVLPYFTNGDSHYIHQTSITTWNSDRVSQRFGFDAGEGNTISADTFEAIWWEDPYRSELYFDLRGSNDGTTWTTIYENREKRYAQTQNEYRFDLATYRYLEFYVVYGTDENGGNYFQQHFDSSNFYFYNFRFYQQEIYGCTNPNSVNYDPTVTVDNGTCEICSTTWNQYDGCSQLGCSEIGGTWLDDGDATTPNCTAPIMGCMDNTATNYNQDATIDDPDSCTYEGCMDPDANNYDQNADISNPDLCTYDPDDEDEQDPTTGYTADPENPKFYDSAALIPEDFIEYAYLGCTNYADLGFCTDYTFAASPEFFEFFQGLIFRGVFLIILVFALFELLLFPILRFFIR